LGQILNYHPQCLISTENRFLYKVIAKNADVRESVRQMEEAALKTFENGLENHDKFGPTLNHYQKKWLSFGPLHREKEFQKQQIKIIGDKKSGGNTDVYLSFPEKVLNFILKNPYYETVCTIQIIRHPIDAAFSLMASHNVETFDAACRHIIFYTKVSYDLLKNLNSPHKYLHYEDLLASPQNEIKSILDWLGLDCSLAWLQNISGVVNQTTKTSSRANEAEYRKKTLSLIDEIGARDAFGRYFEEL